jgi:hypothetical protein
MVYVRRNLSSSLLKQIEEKFILKQVPMKRGKIKYELSITVLEEKENTDEGRQECV